MAKKSSPVSADLFNRVPPSNLEAENSVLGCVMLVNNTLDQVLTVLRPDHFYDGQNRRIFETIVKMYDEQKVAIDAITLADFLESSGHLEEVGGVPKLLELMETVPHAAHVDFYAKIVREKWLQRQLIYVCNDILKQAYHAGDDVNDLLASAEQQMFSISEQQESLSKIDLDAILRDTWDRINSRRDQEGTVSGLDTGFVGLNELTSGYQASELIILAARPSMGKNSVCL